MRTLALPLILAAAQASVPAPSPPPRILELPRPAGGEWLGLYLLGQKAGASHAAVARDTFEGGPAVRSDASVRLSATVGGAPVTRTFEEHRWYEWRDGGRLLGFEARRSGDGGELLTTGRCDELRCRVKLVQGARTEEKILPHPGETVDYADPVRLVAADGKARETPFLDLDKLEARTLVTRLVDRGSRVIEGVKVPVTRVGSRDSGESLESVSVLDPEGRVLELTMGQAMRGVAETEQAARTGAAESVDLFALTRVMLPEAVEPGRRELSLVLAGLPPEFRHTDGRQAFQELGDDRVRVTIRALAPRRKAKLPVDRERFAAELAATSAIDHEAPEVKAIASRLLPAGKGDAWQRASVLLGWVHGSVQKVYGQSADRASLVAAQRKGDCTEHSLLFVALARASGIPARLVHGLVATGDEGGRALYWHEWAEIWAGEWIAVDPTFGQLVADATHLELGRGDDASTVALLGQLRVLQVDAPAAPVR